MKMLLNRTVARAALVLVSFVLLAVVLAATPAMNKAAAHADEGSRRGPRELTATQVDAIQSHIAAMEVSPRPAKDIMTLSQDDVSQGASPPANLTESEANNNFRTADPIAVGDVIAGTIGAKKDQDFFVLDTSGYLWSLENVLFDIDASVEGSPLDAVICLYDADYMLVGCIDDSDRLDPLIYYCMGPPTSSSPFDLSDKAYLKVEEYGHPYVGGGDYAYTLSLSQPLLVSADKSGKVGGVRFTRSDILAWQSFNSGAEKWSMFFDASDVGITADLEAIGSKSPWFAGSSLTFVLGANQVMEVSGGPQTVTPWDIVGLENETTLFNFGDKTSGSFDFRYRGQDYGLTTRAERIDALVGDRVVSTVGRAVLSNGAKYPDEDLFYLGGSHSGSHFDGSMERGMARENLIAADWVPVGLNIHHLLVIQGAGKIAGHRVNQNQIFRFDASDWWPVNVDGIYWNGPDHGFNYPIDAFMVSGW